MGFRKMGDEERAGFLAQPLVAVLAINEPGWPPHVAPVWFHHVPADNTFQVMTPANSKKARLYREGARGLSLSVQTADGPTAKYVNVQGDAQLQPLSTELLHAMVEKYLPKEFRDAYLADPPEDSMFEISPRRIVTGVIE